MSPMGTGNRYDVLPYETGSDYRTNPDQLVMTSWIHGGPLPPSQEARLLDVGCGTGVLAMAHAKNQDH